ncbi:DUF1826 domain-containing protein [Oceanibaculum nanhaiense]|uniref:DUF1826 domain-containing protein n=1 Tax=Oceanibaculum nanhaiense TaxID=1909734 RepID=UPI00396DE676
MIQHLAELPQDAAQPILDCRDSEGLSAITRPGTALVIWRRSLPSGLTEWLAAQDAERLPHSRLLVRTADARRAVSSVMEQADLPAGPVRDWLIGDIEALVQAFADITASESVDIRLEAVSHDSCWKFHRDYVPVRLLTTYRGPATEWVDPAHADAAMQAQKDYEGPIERLEVGDVAIFKGKMAGDADGIVHRSPPVAGTGQTRLLLCLNTPSDVSPEPWSSS